MINGHKPKDRLGMNQHITSGQYIQSKTYSYITRLEHDGELVVYMNDHFHPKNALWRSKKTGGQKPYRLVMQEDGNLVIYDIQNKDIWESGTDGKGSKGHGLVMQDDGNLVIYDGANIPIWDTNTYRKEGVKRNKGVV